MAELERDLNIKANYFILLSSTNYNALSKINRKYINKIHSFGHEIALHFDPSIYMNKLNYFFKKRN
jgi:hypothetical protein